jgi:hypothetical protein
MGEQGGNTMMFRIGMAAAATSALFVGVSMAPAQASQQAPRQDGLVNVNVGDVTVLQDVNIGVIANVVANVCDVADVGPIAAGVLGKARATDNSGRDMTICMAGTDPVTLVQN